jgi:hypothetical protein
MAFTSHFTAIANPTLFGKYVWIGMDFEPASAFSGAQMNVTYTQLCPMPTSYRLHYFTPGEPSYRISLRGSNVGQFSLDLVTGTPIDLQNIKSSIRPKYRYCFYTNGVNTCIDQYRFDEINYNVESISGNHLTRRTFLLAKQYERDTGIENVSIDLMKAFDYTWSTNATLGCI